MPSSDPEALAFRVLEHLKQLDDSDLKCRLYISMVGYYGHFETDLVEAANMCEKSISLAILAGNSKRHSQALDQLAWINIQLGKYSAAQILGNTLQPKCMHMKLKSWQEFPGIYTLKQGPFVQKLSAGKSSVTTQSLALAIMAHSLLALWSASDTNLSIMSTQAEVHKCKSEYTLYLREQDLIRAKTLFEKSLKLAAGNSAIKSFCCERLGNVSSWGQDASITGWTTIFLVHSLKSQKIPQVYKVLQFFGQIFLMQNDGDTAISFLTVALEGFTYMDIHQSRGECMLRLGDIFNSHNDQLKEVKLWTTALPLFERSSQERQVQCVNERLAGIGDVLEQHKENIACLLELNVPPSNPCDIEDEEQVELSDEPYEQVVV
ncbi:hypothetical protein DFH08DRAFT_818670 [Mycena albidolilacea]|uniref:Uncharacterized protein n=1 Tax=Mycena albidolilacea TaxID=1033008 RepID=A0AAD6ZFZ9_9AGAR|nr:hypothetical protein DFH08DRAFT_818670 [Mycena albidolilacea]